LVDGGAGQLGMVIRGLAKLGAAPPDAAHLRFDVTPVAYAAQALATLAARTEVRSLTHHVAGRSTSFAELVAAIRGRVPLVEDPRWADRARAGLADPDIAMA